ncbi:hypothetical protein GJR96_06260 [Haloferax sp. MBLA0076]|uniref:Uncharacterized protein n=1 Tax=Haloferax litoreum TaxID=2666140 RepID=A0A6A8GEJ2_9EURY|nr:MULTISPECIES: hypothetical protein [Haloferax]KAB1193066.1 hypothetical protein Hfx1148_06250 [Haloferax sp. CBA1148]MRX21558.1 hypothetical protein [Haloferax litoreum]
MDRSTAWDATLRIVFGLFVVGIGNAVGGFLASTTGIFGLALYLLVAVPTFVYGMFYVVVGAGMVVEAGTKSALEQSVVTVDETRQQAGTDRRNTDTEGDDSDSTGGS